jgi:hypothetical protein
MTTSHSGFLTRSATSTLFASLMSSSVLRLMKTGLPLHLTVTVVSVCTHLGEGGREAPARDPERPSSVASLRLRCWRCWEEGSGRTELGPVVVCGPLLGRVPRQNNGSYMAPAQQTRSPTTAGQEQDRPWLPVHRPGSGLVTIYIYTYGFPICKLNLHIQAPASSEITD